MWHIYQKPLQKVAKYMHPRSIQTKAFDLKFDYTFRNEKIHIVQPLSFDLVRSQSIGDKAARYMGYSLSLAQTQDVSKLYLLLGKPADKEHRTAYNKAKDSLADMDIVEIVEEDEAPDFANDLEDYMKQHHVIPNGSSPSDHGADGLDNK